MESGVLKKYNASAGSGKTFELTVNYLIKALLSESAYKRILAVTFTNKAAAEMKRKILDYLLLLSKGETTGMDERLLKETELTQEILKEKCSRIINTILHDYSFFNVSTIDSFFQKIIRAFTREVNLPHGYIIEIEPDYILETAVDKTLDDAANDEALMKWIIQYAVDRIEEGKSWNLKADILKLAGEIFNESFRLMSQKDREKLSDRKFLTEYVEELKKIRKKFESEIKEYAKRCREIMNRHNLTGDMFYRGMNGGVGSFIEKIENGINKIYEPPTPTLLRVLENPPVWTKKDGFSLQMKAAFNDGFDKLFLEMLGYYSNNYRIANTARLILENIYIIGILSDILKNVHEVTTQENRFILSDAGELLFKLINGDQTPFIYEKAGNIYENFMIDEFQDTSVIQWNNFLPLINNSLAGGHYNLVVGDIKQSIYRWRNSDWKILGVELDKQFSDKQLLKQSLFINRRSKENIVAFNNTLFSIIPAAIDESLGDQQGELNLRKVYSDVQQLVPEEKKGGYVRIEFIKEDEELFKDIVLKKLPLLIERLQDEGFNASDIGILVRFNSEGAEVIESIINYRNCAGEEKNKKYNYSVVSGESLFLNSSPAVNFIIALLRLAINPDDRLNIAIMLREWCLATGRDSFEADVSDLENTAGKLWPEGWKNIVRRISGIPLYDAIETTIKFFGLGENRENTAFLNALQDCVLEHSSNYFPDISSFIEWWDIFGIGKSLALSDSQNSIRIMTIHKSKGLEFPVVIVPFVSWPMGHGNKNPVMWFKPEYQPFNRIGVVSVKYKKDLIHSYFENDFVQETLHAHVDNLNLLYVAFTRAKNALYCFCPDKTKSGTTADWIKRSFTTDTKPSQNDNKPVINLSDFFDSDKGIFSFGELTANVLEKEQEENRITTGRYYVNTSVKGLRLKLHGEKWFIKEAEKQQLKLNYGKLMHDILASVITLDDITGAVGKMVIDGRINENEGSMIIEKMNSELSRPEVREWFKRGAEIITETDILAPGGTIRRPDRVIISGDKAIVVDFKFGGEKKEDQKQVQQYCRLIKEMGYSSAEAFLWYVDEDKIISVK
ncbi:MAG TPA: UvrD-helicase domain-containing protein [Bacteroidales bacterium]|nr:UvrD-helicase domain-containing protein [Bacteroidales bacterium]HQG53235.1 UvrD-helicase domain-containing protein [Bacteroidales bacterium]